MRKFLIRCTDGTLLVALARPGEAWLPAITRQIEAYQNLCSALGLEPISYTPIERVKL